jgi:hypothetical protein
MSGIRRVSVSLNEQEYQQLTAFAAALCIKPTTAAHKAIIKGLAALVKDAESRQIALRNLALLGQLQAVGIDLESEPVTAELSVISEPENQLADEPKAAFDKQALRDLERVPKDVQRKLRADFGSLTKAVEAGVRAERDNGKWRAVQYG